MLVTVPLLYVLSAGPAIHAWNKLDLDNSKVGDAIHAFYAPLGPFAQSKRPGAVIFRGYLQLWGETVKEYPDPAQQVPVTK